MGKIKKDNRSIPWVEKYRPQSLSEVASQTLTIQSLREFVKKRTFPHLIFTGPAGTGKTSAAVSMINDLLGKENITQDAILERNASDESRMKDLPSLKNFVYHTGIGSNTTFKFVILDEADNLSKEVQSAFRRIIEMAPTNVKFILLCNYVEKIIDPIISRCAIFRFYPLPKQHFDVQIRNIAKLEQVPLTDEVLDAIYYISQGDMRQAINLFQMTVALLEDEAGELQESKINPDIIYEISGFLSQPSLTELYGEIELGHFENIIGLTSKIKSFSSRGLFRQLMTTFISKKYESPKLEFLLTILAEYDYRLTLNSDPTIQLHGLFAEIISTLQAPEDTA